MAKTAFAVMVAGGIICLFDDNKNVLLVSCITILGIIQTITFAYIAYKITKKDWPCL
uniref:hypothetical protein n=1 Tax=Prevotellamassilia timonensis TaxID=1852370 RepID=UPI0040386EA0